MGNFYMAPLVAVVVLVQLCTVCLGGIISSSNITDQLALLAFKSAITYDPNNVLESNWTENSNFCDWFGVSCSRRRQRVTMLILPHMGLRGTISPHIANLSFLVLVDLRNNSFHGALTHEIGRLRRLWGLILQYNMLEGNIPLGLYHCQKLQVISLADNGFTGDIPQELNTLPYLRILYLGANNLTGTIPPSLGNSSNLESIGLEFNNIYGSIPPEMGHHPNYLELYFGANHLSGIIPPQIFNMSSISLLDLNSNAFSGYLPSTTGFWLPNLEILSLDNNQLSGNIPSTLSNSSKLEVLFLDGNHFTGPIPKSIGQLQFMQQLWLDNNQLTGQIPQEIGFMKNMSFLILSNNSLDGTIPSTFGGMEGLQKLYLDENKLQGSIPNEICLLRNLGILHLGYNKLSGSIPSCIGNLSNLQWLTLGSNSLISSIPSTLWNLENLLFLNISFNSFGGSLEPNIPSLKVLESIDFSWNQISGNIPSTIGSFQSLISLNLSRNSFSGPIPQSFANLITLDFLDLSYNNLSGAIPKSLQSLSHLLYLNFSFNNLSGEIPSGGSFANLTAQSFLGNKALCGDPILRVQLCTRHPSENSRTKSLVLKYILPTIASVVIFVSLIFYVLKRYRRNDIQGPHSVDLLPAIEYRFISYHELQRATNDFCEANLLGVGSIGSVYKGVLLDGTNVAVKVLNLQQEGAFKMFDAECKVLRTALHRNLVKIISTCSNPEFRALVLQYMSNGSLEKWLYSFNNCLDLLQRLNIMLDIALALEYLHCGQLEPVVHCDLKPSNVLLDEDMVAHVGDFGIAKILAENKTATQTNTLGTLGYIAPEYGSEGRVSTKGDIYSYGITLLETFTRKKPTDEMFTGELGLSQWVKASLPIKIMDIVDNTLIRGNGGDTNVIQGSLVAIMELGLECSKEFPEERSDIKEVIVKLNKIRMQVLRNNGA